MKIKYYFLLFLILPLNALAIDLFGLKASPNHSISYFDPGTSEDPDITRAISAAIIDFSEVEAALVKFKDEQGQEWRLQVFQSKRWPHGPSIFVPHDNENEAFQTGLRSLHERGGHLLALECGEERLCAGVDPNRNFRPKNKIYLHTILRFFMKKPFPVITLHNNHDSHRQLGGSGSIYADMATPYADGHGFYFAGDPDDLIIFSDTKAMKESPLFELYAEAFEKSQLNFIFEEITPHNSLGGHMSTYVLQSTDKFYFNIESQHGHEAEQAFYLDELFQIMDDL